MSSTTTSIPLGSSIVDGLRWLFGVAPPPPPEQPEQPEQTDFEIYLAAADKDCLDVHAFHAFNEAQPGWTTWPGWNFPELMRARNMRDFVFYTHPHLTRRDGRLVFFHRCEEAHPMFKGDIPPTVPHLVLE